MSESDSLAIKICRVLCILFMSYVHVNPGKVNWIGSPPLYLSQLEFLLSDILGRASVPALSVLSGYLAVYAYQRRKNWWGYAKNRWRALIIPMISWNLIIILLSIIIFAVTGTQSSILRNITLNQLTPLAVLDRLTGLNNGSAITAFNFLRDLFVCGLLLPIMIQLIKRTNVAGVGLVWLWMMTLGLAPIVMREHILMFFIIGVYFAMQSSQITPTWHTLIKLLTTLLLVLATLYFAPIIATHYSGNVPDTVFRLVITSIILITAIALSHHNIGKQIARLEPIAYLMFLSHTSIMLILWGIWQVFFGNQIEWPYIIFYIAAPIMTFAILVRAHQLLRLLPTTLQQAINGKSV